MTLRVKCNIFSGICVQQGKRTRPLSPATVPPLKENDSGEQEESQALKINKAILEFVADMHIK